MELETVERIAHRILEEDPDPVVRFRLLRDVLRLKPDSDTLVRAHKETLKSRWVRELANEQKEDGSWGRFHSAVKCKGKIVTTEAAVERGLALGLEALTRFSRLRQNISRICWWERLRFLTRLNETTVGQRARSCLPLRL